VVVQKERQAGGLEVYPGSPSYKELVALGWQVYPRINRPCHPATCAYDVKRGQPAAYRLNSTPDHFIFPPSSCSCHATKSSPRTFQNLTISGWRRCHSSSSPLQTSSCMKSLPGPSCCNSNQGTCKLIFIFVTSVDMF
jgi:hypothetical protein